MFDLGSITFGQSKDLLIPLSGAVVSKCKFSLTYDTLHEKRKSIKFNLNNSTEQADLRLINRHTFRLQLVHCVRSIFEAQRQKKNNTTTTNAQYSSEALNRLKVLGEEMSQYAKY